MFIRTIILSLWLFSAGVSLANDKERLGDPLLVMDTARGTNGFEIKVWELRPAQNRARIANIFEGAHLLVSTSLPHKPASFALTGTNITAESISFGHVLILDGQGNITAIPIENPLNKTRLNLAAKVNFMHRSANNGALLIDEEGQLIRVGDNLERSNILTLSRYSDIVGTQILEGEEIAVLYRNGELHLHRMPYSTQASEMIASSIQEAEEFIYDRGQLWAKTKRGITHCDPNTNVSTDFPPVASGDHSARNGEIHLLFVDKEGHLLTQYEGQAVRLGFNSYGKREVQILGENYFGETVRKYGVRANANTHLMALSPPRPDQTVRA